MSKPSYGAVYCVYDDDVWLPYSLESTYSSCERIFILLGDRPWQGTATDNSGTVQCIQQFPDPESKISLIRGSWRNETDQRNDGLVILAEEGIERCFIVDADEIYHPEVLRAMMSFASNQPQIDCWHMTLYVYWKNADYRIEPPEAYKPPLFVRVGRGRFTENRLFAARSRGLIPEEVGFCHHMSYARSDEQLQKKIATFSHADELVDHWYEKVWLAWDGNREMEDLHPMHPPAYKRAVKVNPDSLPPVLRNKKNGHGTVLP